jgi:hypothetical protein
MAGSELLVLNPGRRHRRKRRAKARHNRKPRRRRRRVLAVSNPRRHRRRRHNPSHRRRRRNPAAALGRQMFGIPVNQIVMVGTGGIAVEILADKLAGMLPETWKTNADVTRIGTKAAVGIAAPLLLKRFLPRGWGSAIALGGGIVTFLDIVKTYVAPKIPGLNLSGYEIGPTGLSNATIASAPQLGTYIQGGGGSGMSGSPYDDGTYGPIV